MCPRTLRDVMPRADTQSIANEKPPGSRLPCGLHDETAGKIPTRSRDHLVVGTNAERSRSSVEHGAEDARRVRPRKAHPFYRATARHEAACLAVGEERVVRDGGKRTTAGRLASGGSRRRV